MCLPSQTPGMRCAVSGPGLWSTETAPPRPGRRGQRIDHRSNGPTDDKGRRSENRSGPQQTRDRRVTRARCTCLRESGYGGYEMSGTTAPVITVDELIEQIKVGPGGPKVAAFFDFDGTLIQGYSAGALYAHRARNLELGPDEFVRTLRAAVGGPLDEAAFEDLLLQGIRGWVGRTEDDLMELGEQLFSQDVAGALFYGAWRLVRAHQNRGHTVVIATSATRMQAQPMARELGIEHVLCTELETEQGVLTGELAGRTLWGDGKAAAVKEFARRQRTSLRNCYGCANGDEDIAMLDTVGFPHPVNPAPLLAEHAAEHGWDVVRFRGKRGRVHPVALARTTGLYASRSAPAGARR